MNFRQFLEHNPLKIYFPSKGNTVGMHNDGNRDGSVGSFLPSTWTGSEDLGVYGYGMPGTDIQLPTVSVESAIRSIEGYDPKPGGKCKDPIWITMMNGTRFSVPRKYFRANYKGIKEGDKLKIVFRRNPGYTGEEASRIIQVSKI
jgi:hypothetical protein